MAKNNILTMEGSDASAELANPVRADSLEPRRTGEDELLLEVARALRAIQFGSITITLHDGRIVEVQKTERIRKNKSKEQSGGATVSRSSSRERL